MKRFTLVPIIILIVVANANAYPGITPYAYCNWNPVKFIDPDGNDSKMVISGNTITISAKYYAKPNDMQSLQQAVSFWNNQKGLQYIDNKGSLYSVRFDLTALRSNNPQNDVALNADDISNSYKLVSSINVKTYISNAIVTGLTINNNQVQVLEKNANNLTGAHEIGHTLMNTSNQKYEHTTQGIMTTSGTDSQRGEFVSQETVNTIINSHNNQSNKSLWQKIVSFFE